MDRAMHHLRQLKQRGVVSHRQARPAVAQLTDKDALSGAIGQEVGTPRVLPTRMLYAHRLAKFQRNLLTEVKYRWLKRPSLLHQRGNLTGIQDHVRTELNEDDESGLLKCRISVAIEMSIPHPRRIRH
jgi:hypothetical protein